MTHTLHDSTVVILVGGLGTRLRSVLADLPKPMAPVNGQPFLAYLLRQVRDAGLRNVVLCVGYRAEAIETYFGDGRDFGVQIAYSYEQELRGTAGALRLAQPYIASDPFVVMNGDTYCEVDLIEMLAQHQARKAQATIVATCVDDRARFGSLLLGDNGTVAGFTEKGESTGPGYINGGIYVLTGAVLATVPHDKPCSIERDVFPTLVGQGLFAHTTPGQFIDIGIPSELARAATVLPAGEAHIG